MHIKLVETNINICALFYSLQNAFTYVNPIQFPHHYRLKYHYVYFLHKKTETKTLSTMIKITQLTKVRTGAKSQLQVNKKNVREE